MSTRYVGWDEVVHAQKPFVDNDSTKLIELQDKLLNVFQVALNSSRVLSRGFLGGKLPPPPLKQKKKPPASPTQNFTD